jgi:hypothetical protein
MIHSLRNLFESHMSWQFPEEKNKNGLLYAYSIFLCTCLPVLSPLCMIMVSPANVAIEIGLLIGFPLSLACVVVHCMLTNHVTMDEIFMRKYYTGKNKNKSLLLNYGITFIFGCYNYCCLVMLSERIDYFSGLPEWVLHIQPLSQSALYLPIVGAVTIGLFMLFHGIKKYQETNILDRIEN